MMDIMDIVLGIVEERDAPRRIAFRAHCTYVAVGQAPTFHINFIACEYDSFDILTFESWPKDSDSLFASFTRSQSASRP